MKVDVARRVDQVELIDEAIVRFVVELDGLRLDRDATLALEVHRVEHLILRLARGDRAARFEDPIGERGFAVIDVRDDREVTDAIGGERHGHLVDGDAGRYGSC